MTRNKRKCITTVKGLELFGKGVSMYKAHATVFYQNSTTGSSFWNYSLPWCHFSGVKLNDASKKLGKKFATGASVVKVGSFFGIVILLTLSNCEVWTNICLSISHQGPTEKEQIDVQGDIAYDIVEFITDTWPDVISFLLDHISLNYAVIFIYVLRQCRLPLHHVSRINDQENVPLLVCLMFVNFS